MKHIRHIIQKQVLEVEMENPADAFQFRNRLAEVFHEKILPALEVLFDEIGHRNRLIRIDQLEVDAGNISVKNWENELAEKTINQVRQSLLLQNPLWETPSNATEKQQRELVPTAKKKQADQLTSGEFIKAFFFFLETGTLPWFAPNQIQFDEALRTWLERGDVETLRSYLKTADSNAIIRLIYQADDALLDEMVRLLQSQQHDAFHSEFVEAKHSLSRIIKSFSSNPPALKRVLYLPFFKWFSLQDEMDLLTFYPQESARLFQTEFAEIVKQPGLKQKLSEVKSNTLFSKIEVLILSELPLVIEKPQPPAKNKGNEIAGEFYVGNAGLVLLHPFLQPFFKHIGLTVKDHFVNEYAGMKAVLLSQYLVYGAEAFDEHQIILNKILCGYPLDQPIIKELEITREEKEEAASLLQQVIQLWKKNNVQVNGTAKGLQHSFLQRPGKLLQKDKDWQLQVEQKAYDMVLSALPWGIGIIKTPWMQGLLWVDWA